MEESADIVEPEVKQEATEAPATEETGGGDVQEGEEVKGDEVTDEAKANEDIPNEDVIGEGEEMEGEHLEGEHMEGEHVEGEHVEKEDKDKALGEGEEVMGEELEGEQSPGEKKEEKIEEQVEEEEAFVEEPPPDPAAPYDFSDSKEALREPFELRPDQLAEVEQLWELYQNYTPAYTDIKGYITVKELVYMLKCLLLMTYTPEQLLELIEYCVKPPHPDGHINYEQFLKMVILRQRDFPIDEELRAALQVLDPEKTGMIDRDYLKEVLAKQGHKMPQKQMDNLIKEVDMSNDGTIGIDDVVGTMCIDLNKEDLMMLRAAIFPPEEPPPEEEI